MTASAPQCASVHARYSTDRVRGLASVPASVPPRGARTALPQSRHSPSWKSTFVTATTILSNVDVLL